MLIGKTLYLRQLEVSDAEMIAQWSSDPEYWGPFFNVWPQTAREQVKWAEEEVKHDKEGSFLICDNRDDTRSGLIGYYTPASIDLYKGLEIWYQVHPSARRQGFATQATCLLVNHLFSSLPIERLEATTDLRNQASANVLGKAGMTIEGVRRKCVFLKGQYVDMTIHSIIREEWGNEEQYRSGRDF